MRYLPSSPTEDRALLDTIGVPRAEDLLSGIPEALRLKRALDLPTQGSEQGEAWQMMGLANKTTHFCAQFLGAGAYDHFVPSAIVAMISRQEWFTANTPYQPEISQGTLQHIFEYQTLICDLTGLEVTNASLYDGGTACVEAALMAVRVAKKRKTVLVSRGLHPLYREVLPRVERLQGADRSRLAEVLEALHYAEPDLPAAERIARLETAMAVRESLPETADYRVYATRRELAGLLDRAGEAGRAEALLRENALPRPGAREAGFGLQTMARRELAWFLIAPQREPEMLAWWEQQKLYDQIQAMGQGRPRYVLHDGPPYANGRIHIGHALNKVLKDIIVKSKTMSGFQSPYVPGWDCHGLPIEHQVMKELGEKKKDLSVSDIRKLCRAICSKVRRSQREEFKRLGVLGEWDQPYLTMTPGYATIIREFGKFVEQGGVYKGLKPVLWCTQDQTALAEAEVEYDDHVSPSVYVKFPVVTSPEVLGKTFPRGPATSRI